LTLLRLDEGSPAALIMLDISAVCDIISHPTLLKYLKVSFGFKLKALTWIKFKLGVFQSQIEPHQMDIILVYHRDLF